MCFINFSNHSSDSWSECQKTEALKWGKIVDVRFPVVNPEASKQELSVCMHISEHHQKS